MNNKISIGQYIPTNSWLHKIDPRIKIIGLIVLLVSLFLIPISANLASIIMISAFLFFAVILSISARIPLKRVFSGVRPLIFLLTFTFVIQLFTITTGEHIFKTPLTMYISLTSIVAIIALIILYNTTKRILPFRTVYFFIIVFLVFLAQYLLPYVEITKYNFNPTYEGVIRGLFLFLRILTTVLLTSLLTFTTMTTDLNFGFEAIMSPLKLVKIPVEVMAMMLSLILRYIPTLLFETEKIMKAQASRGLDFKESKLKEKITQVIALLVPIFLISINRAEDLSDAMEVRGYVIGAKRTRIDEYKITIKDIASLLATFIILGVIIYFKVTI
ncbi:energy-coupling factor transporter transmembrane component T family protein [Haploplasma axanthum]|uniref:Energy-coupling factor transporter transmembrane protein EcfT n=1 Tax=Haploplasma axanthum TaxID=29552 RepID=A0A449BCJ4_HAPAX|nr:energy-coupling factor transporter transmembrane component T [Haploplasma axanthum]VEU80155.1 Energy-coupling factor transporter transmembrane protein EcfT [Haploplasma axanthum]